MTLPNPPIPVLMVRDVRKTLGGREVLRGVSLSLARGETVALTGPSGGGKTTLLNCLGGLERPDSGSVTLAGRVLAEASVDELASLRRQVLGQVFQFFHLLPTLTAAENIEFPLQLIGIPVAERRVRVAEMIESVGLAHRAHALPGQLSGGEQQRVAVARALVHRPALLLADEPTGNLDTASGRAVLQLMVALCRQHGTALFLVTHSEEAAASCSRRLHLRDGLLED